MKRISADGHPYYYYKKRRKPGPKKKRGPKPKKVLKKRGRKPHAPYEYEIVAFSGRRYNRCVGKYSTLKEAYEGKAELLKQNESVIFEKKNLNCFRVSAQITELEPEYLILKKNRNNENPVRQLRNEYGKLVDHKTSSPFWIIIDKFPCTIEETFWVWGYDKAEDRKDFKWIYENLVISVLENDQTSTVNIYLYNNKVIFRYDGKDFNFVICKNISDAIRMYNLLSDWCKKNKRVFFTGGINGHSLRGKEIMQLIMDKTGWTQRMVVRASTRH